LPFRFPNQNFVCTSVQCLPHAPPPSCFGFCNNTRRVQITKLHIRIFLQLSVTFSKYSPQQPVLEYFHSMFFTHSNTKFHIRTKKKVKSWFCEFQLRSNIDWKLYARSLFYKASIVCHFVSARHHVNRSFPQAHWNSGGK
jgi:hypothetical protein